MKYTHGVLEMLLVMTGGKRRTLHRQDQLYRDRAPGVPEDNKFYLIIRKNVHQGINNRQQNTTIYYSII